MYNDLLRIKAFREQNAAAAVTRQKRVVEECVQSVQHARDEVVRFRAYRIQQEQQRFDDIKGRPVPLQAIENMKLHAAGLKDKESRLESQILVEEKRLKEAQQALEQARQHHADAVREHEKFSEFMAIQREAEQREQALREENELEEVAGAGRQVQSMVSLT
ncbi:MAG: YscO family type III secretion system apparatus protein [Candidatus Competibacteraceae bacterium]|nr:YscO family type III secretion system apparatus protein [Candidatus Competibacteraceae bacterium]